MANKDIFIIRWLDVALLLLASVVCSAQKLTPREWEAIQGSSQYLIGMGIASSID